MFLETYEGGDGLVLFGAFFLIGFRFQRFQVGVAFGHNWMKAKIPNKSKIYSAKDAKSSANLKPETSET